ncbi:hypothetical protein ElyMa_006148600 [Elysia marginata]|uniref:Uncharacterized protein n=1 Tax=Elysia marginata TaxID=1093978 RepID=A0AAV4GZN0_9GAST|nr:hypothetical protein ElyMa_006148600 [Elysia marginata]
MSTFLNTWTVEYIIIETQAQNTAQTSLSLFNSLSHMWADHQLSTGMKIRFCKTAVVSTFTHACEAWNIMDSVEKLINGLPFITRRDPCDTACHPEFNLETAIRKRRLSYADHILRMKPKRLLRCTFVAYNVHIKFLP